MVSRFHLIVLFLIPMIAADAQDLSEHRWKNRLVLILMISQETATLKEQYKIFSKDVEGLRERKLVIYTLTPDQFSKTKYVKEDMVNTSWVESSNVFKRYKKEGNDFEVVLIGLDGGTKLRQTEILKNDKLFAIIDGMPMRRAEIRRKKSD